MRTLLLPLIALLLAGCAAATTTTTTQGGSRSGPITAQMIAEAQGTDAYSVVTRFRPQWLRSRGASSINGDESIAVFLDNTRMGGPEALRNIPINSILSIEYFDASEATTRWGTGFTRGAILVRTQ